MIAVVGVVAIVVVTGLIVWATGELWRGAAVLLLAALFALPVSVGYMNPRVLTCQVEDKDRAARAKGGSDMRVYTADCGVLRVQDMFWAGRFDSADLYASIEPGHTYEFRVTGVRLEFFSKFPNIRSVERVS